MSLLAHACFMARGMERERRELDKQIRFETQEAKRIQLLLGCTWAVALRLAVDRSYAAAHTKDVVGSEVVSGG